MNTAIIIKPVKDGLWVASKSGSKITGRGPSSIEAHCDLLERVAADHAEEKKA